MRGGERGADSEDSVSERQVYLEERLFSEVRSDWDEAADVQVSEPHTFCPQLYKQDFPRGSPIRYSAFFREVFCSLQDGEVFVSA